MTRLALGGRGGILGEANLLRHLARLVPGLASLYEASTDLASIDLVLDNLAAAGNKHQVRFGLNQLHKVSPA